MAFDDLNDTQRKLIIELVEDMASGSYSGLGAYGAFQKGWIVDLRGEGGAASKSIEGVRETDLVILNEKGYLTLSPKRGRSYPTIFLGEKSRQEYESQIGAHSQVDQPTGGLVQPTVGIITPLPKEYAAARAMLEETREHTVPGPGAGRRYLLGELPAAGGGRHILVLALADMGNNLSAARVTRLVEHFPKVRSIIVVGIAGGIPHPERPVEHVRLGDIVVSNREGVVQYDFDKEEYDFENESPVIIPRHSPRPPSAELNEAARLLEAAELSGNRPWMNNIQLADHLPGVDRPPDATDKLASSDDPSLTVSHPADLMRTLGQPRVFLGPIASANKLLKNPKLRDALRNSYHVKAVEMEASGIADATWTAGIGYLVVRGICDYCDMSKGEAWQYYAAVVAAAYMRALLESMSAGSPDEGSTSSVADQHVEPRPQGIDDPGLISELNNLIVRAQRSFSSLTTLVHPLKDSEKVGILESARSSRDALFAYFDQHRVYFDKDLCAKLERFLEVLGSAWSDYNLSQAYNHTKDPEAGMRMNRGFRRVTEEVPALRQEIDLEFRERLRRTSRPGRVVSVQKRSSDALLRLLALEINQNLEEVSAFWNKIEHSVENPLRLATSVADTAFPHLSDAVWQAHSVEIAETMDDERLERIQSVYHRLGQLERIHSHLQNLDREQHANLRAGRAADGGELQMGVPIPGPFDKNAPGLWDELNILVLGLAAEGTPLKD